MKVRTLFTIVLCLVVVGALIILAQENRSVFDQRVDYWGQFDLSVFMSLFLALVAGILLAAITGLGREVAAIVEHRRLRRAGRRAEAIEEEYSRGLIAALEGQTDAAMTHFRAVLERDSRHFNTLLKVGELLRGQGRYADAMEYHQKAHQIREEDTRALYALVDDYEAKGDLDRARGVLGKIIGINKQSVTAWRKLRSLHISQENWSSALEAQERILKLIGQRSSHFEEEQRFSSAIRYERAKTQLAEGGLKEATAGFRRVLKDDPHFIPAHVRLGEALHELGREPEAVETWRRGFETTGSPILLTTLEEHFLQQEQPLSAIEELKSCIAASRKDTIPRFYLGKLYFRLEMLDDALSVLSSLVGRATYAPTLHYLLGRIHDRRQKHRDASREYRRVIRELDLVQLEYVCSRCDETVTEWFDRCPNCQEWNTLEVHFREELSLDELGLSQAPIYSARKL